MCQGLRTTRATPMEGTASMNVMSAAAVDFLVETVGGDICKMGAVFPVTPLPFLPRGYRPRPGSGPATPSEATKPSPSSQLL